MIQIFSAVAGYSLGALLGRKIPYVSGRRSTVMAVFIVLVLVFAIGFGHYLATANDGVALESQNGLTATQLERIKPTFGEQFGSSMGTTLGWCGLGYLAFAISFVLAQKRVQPR